MKEHFIVWIEIERMDAEGNHVCEADTGFGSTARFDDEDDAVDFANALQEMVAQAHTAVALKREGRVNPCSG